MVTISVDERDRILTYARCLVPAEDRGNPVTVPAAALPLLEWAERAVGEDDLRDRMRALRQQHYGRRDSGGDQDPAAFVDDACVLYAFLTADRGEVARDDGLREKLRRLRDLGQADPGGRGGAGSGRPMVLVISDEAAGLLSERSAEGNTARRFVEEAARYGRKAGIGVSVSREAIDRLTGPGDGLRHILRVNLEEPWC